MGPSLGGTRRCVRTREPVGDEARTRRLEEPQVLLVGYDGSRVLAEQLADHVAVTPSEHIRRIQEAQATTYHMLQTLVEHPQAA